MVFFSWRPMTQFIGPTGGGVTSVDWIRQEDSDTQKALLERFPFRWKGELWEPSCLVIFALGLFQDPMPLKDTWVLWEQAAGRLVFFFFGAVTRVTTKKDKPSKTMSQKESKRQTEHMQPDTDL